MGNDLHNIFDEKEKIKFEKLVESAKLLSFKDLSGTFKDLFGKLSKAEERKVFITLLLHYFSNDFIKWNLVKERIDSFDKKEALVKDKKGIFGFLKNNKPEVKSEEKSDEKKFTELYINIGKDKRIFPKDLIHFICSSMRIDANDINNIRIYEKYSFFQIPADMCEKAIVLLSVKSLRGKNIKVNFARNESNGV